MITTLIFDLDGLLSDTEKLHRQAYQEIFGEMGLALADAEYDAHWIRDGKGIADFISKHDLAVDLDAIRTRKADRYRELVCASAQPMPGALSSLRLLRGRVALALATSSYPDAAYAVLETLGIKEYFSRIVTRADVARVKPFPDIFLRAAERMGAQPGECVVVEDAQKGLRAAVAAGMRCIAIPNEHTRGNDFSDADLVLVSLRELTPETLATLDSGP